jgi:F0F1-type ATP synthase assembly protein I
MFDWNQTNHESRLDEAIENVLAEMAGYPADSDEYSQMTDQLTKLYAIKASNKPDRISKDTIAIVVGNLVGILMIVGYEQGHILTSKAGSFLVKIR